MANGALVAYDRDAGHPDGGSNPFKSAHPRIGDRRTAALAANDRSQWHHGYGVQANSTPIANGERPLAANIRSQWHHGYGVQAAFTPLCPRRHGSPTTATHGTQTADRIHLRAHIRELGSAERRHWLRTTAASGTTATAGKLI